MISQLELSCGLWRKCQGCQLCLAMPLPSPSLPRAGSASPTALLLDPKKRAWRAQGTPGHPGLRCGMKCGRQSGISASAASVHVQQRPRRDCVFETHPGEQGTWNPRASWFLLNSCPFKSCVSTSNAFPSSFIFPLIQSQTSSLS